MLDPTAKTLSWFFTAQNSVQDPVCDGKVARGNYPEAFFAGSPTTSPAPPYPWIPGAVSMVTHALSSGVPTPGGGLMGPTTETFTFTY